MNSPSATPARLAPIDSATRQEIVRAVAAARPIGDLMRWLIDAYPDADRDWIFAALKVVYDGGFTIAPASQQSKIYRIGLDLLRACPQRVA